MGNTYLIVWSDHDTSHYSAVFKGCFKIMPSLGSDTIFLKILSKRSEYAILKNCTNEMRAISKLIVRACEYNQLKYPCGKAAA